VRLQRTTSSLTLVDLQADGISEDTRGLDDLSILGQDLFSYTLLYILDPEHVLFSGIRGYVQLAGYFLVGTIEFVQIDDSTYICHRFHLRAHLSAYLERRGFPSWVGQKRIAFSLYRGPKLSRRIH
jgi:hypothetical protein